MSYDMIDRFLRNNLGDDDYAEYSLALDQVASPPQRKPLTDEEIDKLLGPLPRYADEWSMTDFIRFARAIEDAHGIKEKT